MRPTKPFDPNRFTPDIKVITPKKEKKGLKKNPMTEFGKLKKKADEVWSQYIRQYYADQRGKVKCCTCPKVDHWKNMDCGHFIKRGDNAVRFDFRNCAPQCVECNQYKEGMRNEFEKYVDYWHGKGTAEELKQVARKPYKLSREHLELIIDNYKIISR